MIKFDRLRPSLVFHRLSSPVSVVFKFDQVRPTSISLKRTLLYERPPPDPTRTRCTQNFKINVAVLHHKSGRDFRGRFCSQASPECQFPDPSAKILAKTSQRPNKSFNRASKRRIRNKEPNPSHHYTPQNNDNTITHSDMFCQQKVASRFLTFGTCHWK